MIKNNTLVDSPYGYRCRDMALLESTLQTVNILVTILLHLPEGNNFSVVEDPAIQGP